VLHLPYRELPVDDPGAPDTGSPFRYLGWLARHQRWSLSLNAIFGIIWMVAQALVWAGVGAAIDHGVEHHNTAELFKWVGVVIVLGLVLARTTIGRYTYAAGGNPEAAELAGVNTRKITLMMFMLMGVLVAISACITSARLDAASNSLGQFDELYVIAATVIGGTSLAGGVGTIYGAMLGALVMQSLQSGMTLLNFDSAVKDVIVGSVLVFAVWIDQLYRRRQT